MSASWHSYDATSSLVLNDNGGQLVHRIHLETAIQEVSSLKVQLTVLERANKKSLHCIGRLREERDTYKNFYETAAAAACVAEAHRRDARRCEEHRQITEERNEAKRQRLAASEVEDEEAELDAAEIAEADEF